MRPKKSTLRELADATGLSVPTVSRALGGHADIAKATRERVAEAARQLNYVPNRAARMLVSGRSGSVGMVLPVTGPDFLDYFLGAIISGLAEGLAQAGVDLSISAAPPGQTELETLTRLVDSGRVDGVVLTRTKPADPRALLLAERRLPFLCFGRTGVEGHPFIDADGEAVFSDAVARMAAFGHRRIALLSMTDGFSYVAHREAGAVAAAKAAGVSLQVLRRARDDVDGQKQALRALLSQADRPTALLGLVDALALTALEVAADMHLSVPGDLSVVGFDNIPVARRAGLASYEPDNRDIARRAGAEVIRMLRDPDAPPTALVTAPEFVARASLGPAPAPFELNSGGGTT
ncbi:LacI family DNA-binding transcriptional regulator [Paracoccus aurantiacus]|uniref:LacI family DNA-binding transcriptional regulator n=1 Tax=Paracoccus aurantiacus TaxID=2599412 RepID=UPI0036449B30